ncbi:hypothetical protein Tco_0906109, partial [Tanacetum coccineum]
MHGPYIPGGDDNEDDGGGDGNEDDGEDDGGGELTSAILSLKNLRS